MVREGGEGRGREEASRRTRNERQAKNSELRMHNASLDLITVHVRYARSGHKVADTYPIRAWPCRLVDTAVRRTLDKERSSGYNLQYCVGHLQRLVDLPVTVPIQLHRPQQQYDKPAHRLVVSCDFAE